MYHGNKIIAIIPARSGSKGLPNKNILPLEGKPLLFYSISAAADTNVIDEIFVSTDSYEYAEIAKKYGADVPFLRSEKFALDNSSTWDCVLEAIEKYSEIGKTFDIVLLLQPTSPLRSAEDIVAALDLMHEKNADSIVSVCETDHSPLWCNTLPQDNSLKHFISEEAVNTPRQKIPAYYRINGAVYLVKTEYIKNIYDCRSYAYVMPKERSVDIDSKYDFLFAEAIMRETKKNEHTVKNKLSGK